MNDQDLLKESGQFLTEEEILEMDDVLFRTGEDIMKKSGEIINILRNLDSSFQRLRKEYLAARAVSKVQKEALKEEKKKKEELADRADLLLKKYKELKINDERQKSQLESVNLEKERVSEQLDELKHKLSEQEKEYRTREADFRQNQEEYRRYYTDARTDKEKAEEDLRQCRRDLEREKENTKALQELLKKKTEEKEAKAKETEELERKLCMQDDEIRSLDDKMRQYELQKQKMPLLMRLYDAYHSIMEKKDELPREFFERLQNVVPPDDFELFLSKALEPSFPVSYHLSIQAFLSVCGRYGEVSKEAVKEALLCSDRLLSVILDFGEAYHKEEGLVRINMEAGDAFDRSLCKYIDENGGMYGKIVKVWLHGFRDNNKIYCSYVEGE